MRKKWVPSPVFLIFASVLLSAPGGAALCAYYMSRLGRRKQRTLFSVISIILIPVTAGALLTVRTRWYFFAGGLVAFNLIMGVFFMLAVHSPHREMALEMEAAGTKRFHAGARRVIFGILAGFIFGALAGQFFGLFYGWLADVFLSTLLPVNPDIFSQGEFVFFMTLAFMFSGGVIGGIAGGLVRNDGLSAAVKPAISLIATATALMFMWHFFVDVIAFHSYGIAADPYRADLPDIARIVFPLLFTGFSVIGALVINGSSGARELAGRTVLVFFMCLMLTLTTVCYTGIVSYDFLILGKMREKRGDVKGALALYEKSLTLYPSPFSASYLQFRIGLLNHVRGDDAAAADAFRNVLTKYTANKHFVQQAKILSDRLENVKKGERFVLPGVETRTEYRSAYCAPNSMALVFNYWRKNKLTAKKIGTDITYTLFGTSALDMLFYARENGFEYYLTSDNSLNDIREFVKKKIPVLVFIPQHVFVVFGYDMRLDTLISYDVATYDVWVEHPAEDFVAEWSKTGRMMAIMIPESRRIFDGKREKALAGRTRATLQYLLAGEMDSGAVERGRRLEAAVKNSDDPEPFLELFEDYPETRRKLLSSGGLEQAQAASEKRLLDSARKGKVAWNGIGEYLTLEVELKEFRRARDLLETVSGNIDRENQDSNYAEVDSYRGDLDYILGNFDGAISMFSSGEDGMDANFDAYYLGRSYEETGSLRSALETYDGIISSGMESPVFYQNRLAFNRLEKLWNTSLAPQPERMKKTLRNYLENDPYDANAWLKLAELSSAGPELSMERKERARYYLYNGITFAEDSSQLEKAASLKLRIEK